MGNRYLYYLKNEVLKFKPKQHLKKYAVVFFISAVCLAMIHIYLLVLAPLIYFIAFASVPFAKELIISIRYLEVGKIINCYVIKTSKQTNDFKTFTLLTYDEISKYYKNRARLEMYFNTNILSIEHHHSNKKIINLVTCNNTNSEVAKFTKLLGTFEIRITNLSITENDFIKLYKFSSIDTKKLLAEKTNIAMLLGLNPSNLNIIFSNNITLQIIKSNKKVYYLQDFINKDIPKTNYNFLVGVNKSNGKALWGDLEHWLYTLIAGTAGSGKSVCFNNILQSLMFHSDEVAFVMIDYKFLEFKRYSKFNNTIYINNHQDTALILKNLLKEMNRRYQLLASYDDCLNIYDYNKKHGFLPMIVLAIDEVADLKLTKSEHATEIIDNLKILLNKGRASGIVVFLATQRPSHTEFSSDVKALLDTKIGFKVSSTIESGVIGVPEAHLLQRYNSKILQNGNTYYTKSLFIDALHNDIYDELRAKYEGEVGEDKTSQTVANTIKVLKHGLDLTIDEFSINHTQFKQILLDTYKSGDVIAGNKFFIDKMSTANKTVTDKQIRLLKEKTLNELIGKKNKTTYYML